jgi:hypothetical protein
MNVLPTSPDTANSPQAIDRYFRDMHRWNYDVAYSAFYAFPLKKVEQEYAPLYRAFTARAHELGMKACVQIQSTVAFSDDVALEEGQYYADNTTFTYEHFAGTGKKYFFASFASEAWLAFLKKLTQLFRGYGFDWVVYEEPMYRVDIPGTKDRFYQRFQKEYPDLPYPTRQWDSLAYLRVQELKRHVLLEFYDALTRAAKELGFEKCSTMPWFFSPTFENTPMETWNSCCDVGRITFLPAVDFIVVRMQPDNIYGEAMAASSGESLPRLAYLEALSHSLGKPIIAVNNPTNEHLPPRYEGKTLFPYDFFSRYTLAAMAAAPSGMTRHWYGKDYDRDIQHMELLAEVNRYLPRLGTVSSPIAFVFSYHGIARPLPRGWREVWKTYWNFARPLLYYAGLPFLTFYADSLTECLEHHPEVRVIVLSEYFAVGPEERELLRRWLQGRPARRLVYFGGRNGYRYDGQGLYSDFTPRPPEILSLFGIDSEMQVETIALEDSVEIEFVGSNHQDAMLGARSAFACYGYGCPVFDSQVQHEILYRSTHDRTPIITRVRHGSQGGYALYVGCSLDGDNLGLDFSKILTYLLQDGHAEVETQFPFPVVTEHSHGLLWNQTQSGYLVIANCSGKQGRYRIAERVPALWDAKHKRLLSPPYEFELEPLSFHVYRMVSEHSKLLDVEGMVYLTRIEESSKSIHIDAYWQGNAALTLGHTPHQIIWCEHVLAFDVEEHNGVFIATTAIPKSGDARISVTFK